MMCGRFVGFRSLEELKDLFPIDRAACEVVANFNVAPTQEVLVITELEGILKDDIYREFESYSVSKQVNSTRYNAPSCVEPAKRDPIFE